jgi:hypothetical protein
MLKNISNLGSVLNKSEQKSINGGEGNCPSGYCRNLSGGCTHLASAPFDDCI